MCTALAKWSAFRRTVRAIYAVPSTQKRLVHDGFASLNIYKDAARAPKEMDDKDYPEWLWKVLDAQPTKEELLRSAEMHYTKGGYDAVFENMSEEELTRLFRLDQRDRIKENNSLRRGGKVI